MLEAICKMIRGFAAVDEGVESFLTQEAFDGFLELIETVYGLHAKEVIENQWSMRDDGSMVCLIEEAEEAFRLCLTGRG